MNHKDQKEGNGRREIQFDAGSSKLRDVRIGSTWTHFVLIILLLLIVLISVFYIFVPPSGLVRFAGENFPLHSTIEALGAIAAILMAFMPYQLLFGKSKPSYIFISIGFLVMGIWDLFHSVHQIGNGFVFTHSLALLSGGLSFSLILFPWKFKVESTKKYLYFFGALTTVLLSVLATFDRSIFPEMVRNGSFTTTADAINLIAGILFFLSTIKLLVIYVKDKSLGLLILIFLAVSSGIVGTTFHLSALWDVSWWLWHIIRLLAFFAMLVYMLWRIQRVSIDLNLALWNLKEQYVAITESEKKFKDLFQNDPSAIIIAEPSTGVVFDVNPAAEKLMGMNRNELIGLHQSRLHPEDAMEDQIRQFEESKNKANVTVTSEILTKSGQRKQVEIKVSRVEIDNKPYTIGIFHDISELIEQQKQLKQSEDKYHAILDSLPGLFYKISTEGRFVIWNKNFETVSGYSAQEMTEISPLDLFENEDRINIDQSMQKVFSEGEASVEATLVAKDGTKTPYFFTGKTIFIDQTPYLSGMAMDISDRIEAETKLIASEEKYRTLIKSTPLPLCLVGDDGEFQYINDRFIQVFGYTMDDVPTLDAWWKTAYPDEEYRGWVLDTWGKAVENARIQHIDIESVEYEVTCKDQSVRSIIISGIALEEGFLATFIDNTERKKAEDKLRDSEHKFRQIFDFSPVGIVMVGLDKKFIHCNKAFSSLLGYSQEEMTGRSIDAITYPDDLLIGMEEMKSLSMDQISTANVQKRYLRKDNQIIWADLTISLIRDNEDAPKYFLGINQDITSKKRYENEVLPKDIVFESSVSANSTADVSGILTNVNAAFLKIWGYEKEEEVLGRSLAEFIYHEHEAIEIITSLNETGKWSGEFFGIKKDQTIFQAQANASVLKDADGNFIGYQSTVIDITEKKKAEEERNQFFNLTLDHLCVAGMDGYFKSVNPSWTKTFGYTEKEFLAKPFVEFIHPEDVESTLQAVSQLSKQNPVINFINRYRRIDGSYRWLSWVAAPSGETIFAAAHDITDIKLAEEKLTEFNKELEKLVLERTIDLEKNRKLLDETSRLARVGGWEIDLLQNKVIWTDEVYQIHEVSPDEFTPSVEGGINFYTPEAIPIISEAVEKAITSGTPFDLELQIITAKKRIIWVRAIGQSYSENNKVVKVGGVFQDINHKKLIEEELRKYQENLEQLVEEKTSELSEAVTNLERSNQELEQFAYIASHDLQEPLRMVSSYTQLLEKRYADKLDQDAKDFIGYAVDGSIRMQRLINDLLQYSRVTTKGKALEKLDLTSTLGYAVSNLYQTIQETGTIITQDPLPSCLGDEGQLIRVFQNLLGNAIKFTKDKAPRIHVSAEETDDNWIISVKDNGIGIDIKYKEKIFTIFQRLHNKTKYAGTGIGLAICKRTIERHGGTIWFESKPGEGTTFMFTLKKA